MPNGITTSYQYNGLDQLTRIQDTLGPTTIADHQYSYSASGRITKYVDSGGTHAYTYGVVYRLFAATLNGQQVENYKVDGAGNRTSSHLSASYSYQPFNKLVSTGTASYSYDNNGNLILVMSVPPSS